MSEKFKCPLCDWRGLANDLLRAASPFDPSDFISGCPKCKGVDICKIVCDEPGCWREVACGTPTVNGYRNTCPEHIPPKK